MANILIWQTSMVLLVPISGGMFTAIKVDKNQSHVSHVGILLVSGFSIFPFVLYEFVMMPHGYFIKLSHLIFSIWTTVLSQGSLLCFIIIANTFIKYSDRVYNVWLVDAVSKDMKLHLSLDILQEYDRLQKSGEQYLLLLHLVHSFTFVFNTFYVVLKFFENDLISALTSMGYSVNDLLMLYCVASVSSEAFTGITRLQDIVRLVTNSCLKYQLYEISTDLHYKKLIF